MIVLQAQHAKRTQALAQLPPYQTEIVRAVTREIRELDKNASNILSSFGGSFNPSNDPAAACSLLVDHLCMRRNKRCLLVYHRVRLEKLEQKCWDGEDLLSQDSNLADQSNGNESSSALSPEEEDYVRQYNDLLAAHKGQWTDIDLGGSLDPPKDLFIDVRVLKDAGEIQTEYGFVCHNYEICITDLDARSIMLTKNSQFFVRQGDVEHLIAQKFLQKLT